jgi:hypothetical protein
MKIRQQSRIDLCRRLAPASVPADAIRRRWRDLAAEFPQRAPDGAPGYARDPRDGLNTAMAGRFRLRRRQPTTTSLVQKRRKGFKSPPDPNLVNHIASLGASILQGNPPNWKIAHEPSR